MKTKYLPYGYILVVFFIARVVVEFDGLYGQDSYEYLRYSKLVHQFLIGGEHPGNYFWAIGFPLLIGILSTIGIPVLTVIQLVNLISLLGIVFFTKKIIEEIFGEDDNLPTYLLLTLSSPYLVRASLVAMTDIFTTFCLTAAFLLGLKYNKSNSTIFLIGFSCFACYAVFTRYVSGLPLLLLGLLVILTYIKGRQWYQIFIIIVPIFLIVIHLYFKQSETSFFSNQWLALAKWNVNHMFSSEFYTDSDHQLYVVPNLLYAFSSFAHVGFLVTGLVLAPIFIKNFKKILERNYVALIALSIVLYGLFLAGIPLQNKRFLLITFPLIVVLFYPSHVFLTGRLSEIRIFKNKMLNSLILIILMINMVITLYVMQMPVKRNRLESKISIAIKPYQGRTLYGFDIDVALKGRGMIFDYKNLWESEYVQFEVGSLVIFNEQANTKQWHGKSPMNNWNKLKNSYKLIPLQSFGDGWNLYEIR